jgi:uncharacterized protein YukE
VARFYVSTGEVGQTAAALQSLAAVFDQQVDAADTAVNAVVGASWTGTSADEFAQSWQLLVAEAAATRAALSSVISRMQSAEVTYVATDGSSANNSNAIVGAFTRSAGSSSSNDDGK